MNILIYNEDVHVEGVPMRAAYPNGIHGALVEALDGNGYNITVCTLANVAEVVTDEKLAETDVMLWWGHVAHDAVPDSVARSVRKAVNKGMGFVALHSAHESKPFRLLMGTSCSLRWRDGDRERLWVTAPSHPITEGLPEYFELEHEEMYGEFFDIPTPDEVIFMGWFAGGEVFRSGCTFTKGFGKIFYFQPGHEEFPTYYNKNIIKVINNGVKWVAPVRRCQYSGSRHVESPEQSRGGAE